MRQYILLTGSTGLVGRYLVRDLLRSGHRLALLIRPAAQQTIQARSEAILQQWEAELGDTLPRPVCLSGDVSEPGLGLSAADSRWIATHCDRVLHNAATLTFYGKDRTREPWKTNLQGTQQLLEKCRLWKTQELHYVSTAYVCGLREGVIREDELDCGQEFRNDYEHSKFLAEQAVRAADFLPSRTIYRPAVIAGDAQTGYTSSYHGLYMYLQLMALICRNTEPDANGVRHTNIRMNMTGHEPRNVVPVDWVSAVLCRLFETRAAHGGTYHLAPQVRITPRQVIEAGYKYFNSCGVEFCGKDAAVQDEQNRIEKAAFDNKTMYEPYEHSDPIFDTTQLLRFTADLPCPAIDEAMLHRFWKFGEKDRWGRRKPAQPLLPPSLDASLSDTAYELAGRISDDPLDLLRKGLGVDALGPGGGQWTLTLNSQQQVLVEAGLPSHAGILQCSAAELRDGSIRCVPPPPHHFAAALTSREV